eukprot:1127560-Amphidinium_carterae.2
MRSRLKVKHEGSYELRVFLYLVSAVRMRLSLSPSALSGFVGLSMQQKPAIPRVSVQLLLATVVSPTAPRLHPLTGTPQLLHKWTRAKSDPAIRQDHSSLQAADKKASQDCRLI